MGALRHMQVVVDDHTLNSFSLDDVPGGMPLLLRLM